MQGRKRFFCVYNQYENTRFFGFFLKHIHNTKQEYSKQNHIHNKQCKDTNFFCFVIFIINMRIQYICS